MLSLDMQGVCTCAPLLSHMHDLSLERKRAEIQKLSRGDGPEQGLVFLWQAVVHVHVCFCCFWS